MSFSGGAFDNNKTLWSSWGVMGPTQRLYFSGDTGYCSVFKAVGQTHGPFDVALLPIGAYCPRDFMQPAHIDPAEAVKIHIELQARTSIGMHWGTFVLYVLTQQEVDSHRSLAHAHTHTHTLSLWLLERMNQSWSLHNDCEPSWRHKVFHLSNS
jgi:N-acyl-phosphatidylethanolamine-hydrolysing phospholipase D